MDWRCNKCGRCCRFWDVNVTKNEIKSIEKLGYQRRIFMRKKGRINLLKKKFNRCIFLSNNECSIQKNHGYDFKPKVCKKFPYSNGPNQMVCGDFLNIGLNEKPFPTGGNFMIGKRTIGAKTMLYAISKLQPNNYLGLWNHILTQLPKNRSKKITKIEIDRISSSYEGGSIPSCFLMRSALSSYTFNYIYGLVMLYSKRSIKLSMPTGKMRLEGRRTKSIRIKSSDIASFFTLLCKGHGIVRQPGFPQHLLFCLYFLEDFTRTMAYKNKRNEANVADIANAYSKLNSILRFPS
jgi:Fe-S-cluster containining protein